jgi:hypothetical protein
MRLWVEYAWQQVAHPDDGHPDAVSTFQTERLFCAILVGGFVPPAGGMDAKRIASDLAELVARGQTPEEVLPVVRSLLPQDFHVPVSLLRVEEGWRAELLECDAPPLFLVRGRHLVLLPVVEEEADGHLLRRCSFRLQAGDRLAMVSEGFIRARGWCRRWCWQEVARAHKRLADGGGGVEEWLGALVRTYLRLSEGWPERKATVLAMYVRPVRTLTVWSGPPADPGRDEEALTKLMAETGWRAICGDTTAQIAARLLGKDLRVETRPADGWMEVPPTSALEGVDLVTEGLVTMRIARRRLQEAHRLRDLPRQTDGATRLARLLWQADIVRFLVGLAVNPAQAGDVAGKTPLRRIVVEELAEELRRKGKIVSVEYL